jgi:cytoskeleton protein RodZ
VSNGNSSHDAPRSAPDDAAAPAPEPSEPSDSIGLLLSRARREAGMSVEAVSTATRVRVPIVRAIELDDFERCGGDVYARGHIRAFARAVGLDPEPLVGRYDADHGGRPAPTRVAPVYQTGKVSAEPRRANWTAAMIAAIAVVVAFVGFNLFTGGSGHPVAGRASQDGASSRPSASASARPGGTPSARPSASASASASAPQDGGSPIAAAPGNKVVVKLTAGAGRSWVTATGSDGRTLFQGLLKNGQSTTLTDDKKISLLLGNAGAVQLFVNGKDLGTAGADGHLMRTVFTPGNPQAG